MRRHLFAASLALTACSAPNGEDGLEDPFADVPRVAIDRFSPEAGTLLVRDEDPQLPGPNVPVDFDDGFITQGLGPQGGVIRYYNFDVSSMEPMKVYVAYRESEDEPVADQLPLVPAIPGENRYNDFWWVHRVIVPDDYEANELRSVTAMEAAGYPIEETDELFNRPLVPDGSTASERAGGESNELHSAWYEEEIAPHFSFEEAELTTPGDVPYAPIYVCFNIPPGEDGGGPPSGFCTEDDGVQTHNVLGAAPGQGSYSPLWDVVAYDAAAFDEVSDLTSAQNAPIVGQALAMVNCPTVFVE